MADEKKNGSWMSVVVIGAVISGLAAFASIIMAVTGPINKTVTDLKEDLDVIVRARTVEAEDGLENEREDGEQAAHITFLQMAVSSITSAMELDNTRELSDARDASFQSANVAKLSADIVAIREQIKELDIKLQLEITAADILHTEKANALDTKLQIEISSNTAMVRDLRSFLTPIQTWMLERAANTTDAAHEERIKALEKQ